MKKVLKMTPTTSRLASNAIVVAFLLLIAVPSLSLSQNMSWRPICGSTWNGVISFAVSQNGGIYFGTDKDELFRSLDTGKTWERIDLDTNLLGIRKIYVDSKFIFLVTQMQGIFRSSNEGTSWEKVNYGLKTLNINSIIKDSRNQYYVYALNDGVYYSRNNGDNWKKLPNSPNLGNSFLNVLEISKNDYIILAGDDKVYNSYDLGNTWKSYKMPDTTSSIQCCNILNNTIFVGRSDGSILGANVKDDSLEVIKSRTVISKVIIIAIDRDDGGNIYLFTDKGLYIVDSLHQYTNHLNEDAYKAIYRLNDEFIYLLTNNSDLIVSKDHGKSGKKLIKNLSKDTITCIEPVSQKENYVILNSRNVCKTIDNSNNWFILGNGIPDSSKLEKIILGNNDIPYILTDNNGVMKYNTSQDKWITANTGFTSLTLHSISVNETHDLFAITDDGMFKLSAADSVWEKIDGTIISGVFYNDKKNLLEIIQSDNKLIMYDTQNNSFYKIDASANLKFRILCTAANTLDGIYVGTYGGGVFYSSDKGKTWIEKNLQLTKQIIYKMLITPNDELIIYAYKGGIYYSTFRGDSWEKANDGLTNLEITSMSLGLSGDVFAGTAGSGLFICDSIRNLPIAISSGWIDSTGFKIQRMKLGETTKIQYSLDGKNIYTYSTDKFYRIWDAKSGYLLKEYFLNFDFIRDIAIHQEGRYLAIVLDSYIDHIYDLVTDTILTNIFPTKDFSTHSFGSHLTNGTAIFNEPKNELITGVEVVEDAGGQGWTRGYNYSWNYLTGTRINKYNEGGIKGFSKSGDNKLLALNQYSYYWTSQSHGGINESSYYVALFNLESNERMKLDLDTNIKSYYTCVAFSNDAKYIATANGANIIDIFKTSDGTHYRSIINGYKYGDYAPHCIRFSRNDMYLFVSSDNSQNSSILNIYNVNTSQLLDSIKFKKAGHEWVIDFAPDSIHFVIASAYGEMRLYTLDVHPVDSVILVPMTEMGISLYKNYSGGLYPDGMNTMPAAHNEAGIEQMKQVVPLDTAGKLDQQNGKVVMLSIGMSNATQEFSNFKSTVDTSSLKNPRLVLVDGAQGGQTAAVIQDPDANFWNVVNQRLANAGVSKNQVQAIWLKEADAGPKNDFPVHAQTLTSEMVKICRNIKSKFPNVRLCYVSSRTYGGYATTNLNPEPMAYESGFAVKWLIQSQIDGDTNLTFSGNNPKSPWLSWGPYLWANGTKPRAGDGLTWLIDDFVASDRTHPSESGRVKVANLLLDFFVNDEITKYWFTNVFTSVNGDDKSFEITLSPNPATEYIEISGFKPLAMSWAEEQIRIYNALGEIVLTVGAIHELPLRIDVSSLPPGVYFVRVGDKANKFVKI